MKSHLGLNFNWIIAFIWAKASSDWVPEITTSGFAAATPEMIGVRSADSAG